MKKLIRKFIILIAIISAATTASTLCHSTFALDESIHENNQQIEINLTDKYEYKHWIENIENIFNEIMNTKMEHKLFIYQIESDKSIKNKKQKIEVQDKLIDDTKIAIIDLNKAATWEMLKNALDAAHECSSTESEEYRQKAKHFFKLYYGCVSWANKFENVVNHKNNLQENHDDLKIDQNLIDYARNEIEKIINEQQEKNKTLQQHVASVAQAHKASHNNNFTLETNYSNFYNPTEIENETYKSVYENHEVVDVESESCESIHDIGFDENDENNEENPTYYLTRK